MTNKVIDAALALEGVEQTIVNCVQLELDTDHSMRAALAIATEKVNSPEQCLLITAFIRDVLTNVDRRMEKVLNHVDEKFDGEITN